MITTVFTTDESRHSLVKITGNGKKWTVCRLKEITKVEVKRKDKPSEFRYKVEWEPKQAEPEWNRDARNGKGGYCNYYTYKPYDDRDVSPSVTLKMIEYVKTWCFYMVRWNIPTTLTEDQVSNEFVTVPD